MKLPKITSEKILDTLLPSVFGFFYLFLFMHIISVLITQDYSVYFNYATIMITLFGFTLLGTFFGISKAPEELKKDIISINRLFLLGAISFLILYAMTGFLSVVKDTSDYAESIFSIGFLIFSLIGVIGLSWGTTKLSMSLKKWNSLAIKNNDK